MTKIGCTVHDGCNLGGYCRTKLSEHTQWASMLQHYTEAVADTSGDTVADSLTVLAPSTSPIRSL